MQRPYLAQHAIQPITHSQKTLFGLEVNIGSVLFGRIVQNGVDKPHHRLAIFVEIRLQTRVVDFAGFDFVQDTVDRQFEPVILLDAGDDVRFSRQHRLDNNTVRHQRAYLIEGYDIGRIGNSDNEFVLITHQRHGKNVVTPGGVLGNQQQRGRVRHRIGEIYRDLTQALGQNIAYRRLGHESQADQ